MRCEVIIPVGPGHEDLYKRAVESVRIATLDKGPFESVGIRLVDDTDGRLGRSKARNQGTEQTTADWIFFLDADDVLHPSAFRNFQTYTGYDACFGSIQELQNGVVHARYQVPVITSLQELLAFDPYLTLQMGHFVRADVAGKFPFDETMNTGEDWDYYLRLWRECVCVKVDKPFFINDRTQHSTGPRAATGVDWRAVVDPMIQEARDALPKPA